MKKILLLPFLAALLSACNLTVTVEGQGHVGSADGHVDCGDTCAASYSSSQNTLVELQATPAQGYVFGGWGGACSG